MWYLCFKLVNLQSAFFSCLIGSWSNYRCAKFVKNIKHPLESMSQVKAYKQISEVPGFEYLQFFGTLRCPLFFWQNLQKYLLTTHRKQKIRGTRLWRARNRKKHEAGTENGTISVISPSHAPPTNHFRFDMASLFIPILHKMHRAGYLTT